MGHNRASGSQGRPIFALLTKKPRRKLWIVICRKLVTGGALERISGLLVVSDSILLLLSFYLYLHLVSTSLTGVCFRYIEVFRSTVDEMQRMGSEADRVLGGYGKSSTRPGPYSFSGASGPVPLCSIPFPDFGGPPGRGRKFEFFLVGSIKGRHKSKSQNA